MEVTFRLIPDDLTNYRYAVRDRLARIPGQGLWSQHWARAGVIFLSSLVLFLVLDSVVPRITGARLSMVELVIGFVIGIAVLLGMFWLNHFDQAKKLVRPDGPTLSEHTVSAGASGLSVSATHMSAHYAWGAIEDVTQERGLVVLWLEPSLGLVIPQRAFANPQERETFVAAIAARRSEAGLPRAGSFAAS